MTIRTIEAPMPGVIYLKATPDSAPYKQRGDLVAAGDTIALIEVMKSFMPVEADSSGRLLRFLVVNEDAVEPGQPICEIEIAD